MLTVPESTSSYFTSSTEDTWPSRVEDKVHTRTQPRARSRGRPQPRGRQSDAGHHVGEPNSASEAEDAGGAADTEDESPARPSMFARLPPYDDTSKKRPKIRRSDS